MNNYIYIRFNMDILRLNSFKLKHFNMIPKKLISIIKAFSALIF